ncbi:MAG: hypothetical protein PHX04_05140 [Bacilli bacterium]|nr:hypothetical protein [Bacilli bacterium]
MKNIKKYIILILIITGIGIAFSLTVTFAKYVKNIFWEYNLKTKEFYFSSPELDIKSKDNVNNSWDEDLVYFTITNSLNDELITTYDIDYEASCEVVGDLKDYAECQISDSSGSLSSYQSCVNNLEDGTDVSDFTKSECELGGYNWAYQKSTKELYFEIIKNDPEYELGTITVDIEVKSTFPYTKTLKGIFTLYPQKIEDNLIIDYENYDYEGALILSNIESEEVCLNISWDLEKYLLDEKIDLYNTYEVDEEGYLKSINLNIMPYSSLEIKFIKKTSEELIKNDILIEKCE